VSIGEGSTVTIGLAVVLAGVLFRGTWLIAAMSTKIDNIFTLLVALTERTEKLESRVTEVEKRVEKLEDDK